MNTQGELKQISVRRYMRHGQSNERLVRHAKNRDPGEPAPDGPLVGGVTGTEPASSTVAATKPILQGQAVTFVGGSFVSILHIACLRRWASAS